MKRVHVIYRGMVQGVGFRFTVQRLAVDLDIKGWVRNLPNGGVELVAEQDEDVLEDFLNRIMRYFSRYIHDTEIDWEEAKGEFKDFSIRL